MTPNLIKSYITTACLALGTIVAFVGLERRIEALEQHRPSQVILHKTIIEHHISFQHFLGNISHLCSSIEGTSFAGYNSPRPESPNGYITCDYGTGSEKYPAYIDLPQDIGETP